MPRTPAHAGITINYEVHGAGPPLLLISGTGHDLSFWSGQLPTFAARYRVVIFDNRGVGASTIPPGDAGYTLADMADDAARVLDDAGIARAHVMGFSMGGHIAQELALNHGDRVASLGIHHSWTRPGARLRMFQEARLRLARAGDRESLVDLSFAALFSAAYFDARGAEMVERRRRYIDHSPPDDGWAGQLVACIHGDTWDRLPTLDVPTLVTASDLDIIAPPHYAREIHERIAGSQLVILEGSGHVALIETPDAFAELCLGFLAERTI